MSDVIIEAFHADLWFFRGGRFEAEISERRDEWLCFAIGRNVCPRWHALDSFAQRSPAFRIV